MPNCPLIPALLRILSFLQRQATQIFVQLSFHDTFFCTCSNPVYSHRDENAYFLQPLTFLPSTSTSSAVQRCSDTFAWDGNWSCSSSDSSVSAGHNLALAHIQYSFAHFPWDFTGLLARTALSSHLSVVMVGFWVGIELKTHRCVHTCSQLCF